MKKGSVQIQSRIDTSTFQSFALYDTFIRQKRWRAPALFAAILCAFAIICFAMMGSREQAGLLGSVLLGVGLALPAAYLLSFVLSVRAQAKKMELSADKVAYTVHLDHLAVRVTSGKDQAEYRWKDISRAHRAKGCIYLYVQEQQAFLLPDCGQSDAAWELILTHLPAEKLGKKS